MHQKNNFNQIYQSVYIDSHTHSYKSCNLSTYETICHPSMQKSNSFAIHPWQIKQLTDIECQKSFQQLNKYTVIGETGLDRAISTDFDLQIQVFERHLRHAQQYQKTCIIHCVKSESDLLSIRKRFKNNWFIHGFFGNSINIQQFLKLNKNTWFGFGHRIFNSKKLQKTILDCPLEHILLETDSQNKYKIEDIYKEVSTLKNICLEDLIQNIKKNYINCFQIKGHKCLIG